MRDFELGPAVIARVAGFPLATLDELADGDLAARAADAFESPRQMAAFEAAYAASAETGRARLWELTAAAPGFMRALAFANPRLAGLVAREPSRAPGHKKRRHIESRLYRYLARAATRCQPFGLWAGVALAGFGPQTRVKDGRTSLRVAPELAPWYALVNALAARPAYRGRGPWQLNPTLAQSGEREWRFWRRGASGCTEHALQGWTAEPFRRLREGGAASLAELAERLAPCAGSTELALPALEACIDAGVLVGGLEAPWHFADPDEALLKIEASLLDADAAAWRAARLAVASLCRRLEQRGADLTAGEILSAMQAAGATAAELAARLGLPPPSAAVPLRCDLGSPHEIELGDEVRSLIAATLGEYLDFQAGWGFGRDLRDAVLQHYLPPDSPARPLSALPVACAFSGTPTWQALGEMLAAGGEFAARVGRWEALLASGAGTQVAAGDGPAVPAPPIGWLRLGLAGTGSGPPLVHGLHDDLWGAYARHAPMWRQVGATDPLQTWLREQLAQAERQSGLRFAELVAPSHGVPNALARPSLGLPVVAPWSALPGSIDLARARIVRAPGGCATVLECDDLRLAVLNTAAADLQGGDPLSQLLLTTSLAATPSTTLQASTLMFAAEAGGRWSPAISLPGGALVRGARKRITDDDRRALGDPRPARRFAAWAALARRERWPERLLLRREDGLAVALHRDSPVALNALLAGAGTQSLVVEHLPADDWLIDAAGQRFVAELAVPFRRRQHLWSGCSAR